MHEPYYIAQETNLNQRDTFKKRNNQCSFYNYSLLIGFPILAIDLQLRDYNNGSAYSYQEKLSYLQHLKILSFLSGILSLIALGTAIYYFLWIPANFLQIIIIFSSILSIISTFTFFWVKSTSQLLFQLQITSSRILISYRSTFFTQVLFNLTILAAITNLLFCIYFYQGISEIKSQYIALYGEESLKSFQSKLFYWMLETYSSLILGHEIYLIISGILFIIVELILFFFIFCEFIMSIGLLDMFTSLYFFNIMFIITSFMVIFSVNKSDQQKQEESQQTSPLFSQALNFGYVALIKAALNLVVIFRKRRTEIIWLQKTILIGFFLTSAFVYFLQKESLSMEDYSKQNWIDSLSIMDAQKVEQRVNCRKYKLNQNNSITNNSSQNLNIYSQDCDSELLSIIWEQEQNIPVSDRQYQLGCLNINCMRQLELYSSLWARILITVLALANGLLFIIFSLFIQIQLSTGRNEPQNSKMDIYFTVFTILVIIVGLIWSYNQGFRIEIPSFIN